jgi:hypothetical protein
MEPPSRRSRAFFPRGCCTSTAHGLATFLGLRDGRDEGDRARPVIDPVGGVSDVVEFPVLGGILVGGVEDCLSKEDSPIGLNLV